MVKKIINTGVGNYSVTSSKLSMQDDIMWINAISGESVMVPASLCNCLSSTLMYIAKEKQVPQRSMIAIRPGSYTIVQMLGDTMPGYYPNDSYLWDFHCHVCDDRTDILYSCIKCVNDVCHECRKDDQCSDAKTLNG